MLELVSGQGYEATTVSDVISLIGMSRKTFYEHFEDRRGCFMWVCEQVGAQWLGQAKEAIAATPEGGSRTLALLTALFTRAIEQPGALRTVMLEPAVVRPGGPELRKRAIDQWSAMLAGVLQEDDPSAPRLSPELAAAIFGGIARTLHMRLPAGVKPRAPRRRELMDLVPQLAEWARAYVDRPPPARPLPSREDGTRAPLLFGGRAPGTLALSSRSNERRGLPRGENPISRSFVVHSQRERILDAVANLAAAKGYAALTIPEIVQEAAVSVQAFYEHFAGKEDAFLVAYEVGHRRALVTFERAFDSQEDWPHAIHAGLQTLFGFFAAEPAFAHCALVERAQRQRARHGAAGAGNGRLRADVRGRLRGGGRQASAAADRDRGNALRAARALLRPGRQRAGARACRPRPRGNLHRSGALHRRRSGRPDRRGRRWPRNPTATAAARVRPGGVKLTSRRRRSSPPAPSRRSRRRLRSALAGSRGWRPTSALPDSRGSRSRG